MHVAALVTGGKDSALALYRALKQGNEVRYLVTMLPQREDSWMFHFPNIHLTDLFAEAVGIPIVKAETTGIKEKELKDLKNLLATLDIEGVVSGAISSRYQKERIDKICQELSLMSIAPLWQEDPIRLIKDITGNFHDSTAIHGEGSLAAQRMAIYAAANWARYKSVAKRVAGIPGWENLPEFKDLPECPPKFDF